MELKKSKTLRSVVRGRTSEKYDYIVCTIDTALYKEKTNIGYAEYNLDFFKNDNTYINGMSFCFLFYDDKIILRPLLTSFDELRTIAKKRFDEFAENSNNVFLESEIEYIEERFWKRIPFARFF